MARIGSVNIDLLRPDFEQSNKLMKDSLDSLPTMADPLKKAIDGNIEYFQDSKVGELKAQLQQIMPDDLSDPTQFKNYLSEADNIAASLGGHRWGINPDKVISTANQAATSTIDRNTALSTLTKADLENTEKAAEHDYNRFVNEARFYQLQDPKFDSQKYVYEQMIKGGHPVDVANKFLDDHTKQQNLIDSRLANAIATVAAKYGPEVASQLSQVVMEGYENTNRQVTTNADQAYNMLGKGANLGGKGTALPGSQGSQGSSSSSAKVAPVPQEYESAFAQAAKSTGLDVNLLKGMAMAESTFNSTAVSPKGATGIMQLGAAAAQEVNVKDRNDPNENIRGGAEYLKKQLNEFKDLPTALVAYNWGPGKARDWVKGGSNFNNLPKETRNYVNRVLSMQGEYAAGIQPSAGQTISNAAGGGMPAISNPKAIKYTNSKATRNLPVAEKVTNIVLPHLNKYNLEWVVNSGGQDPKGPTVGGSAHNHGMAGDGVLKYANGKQLSFSNAEDRKVISQLIEDLAANGITGIGAHEKYMGDGAIHIGIQNNALAWGGTNGKASTKENVHPWVVEAFNRGRQKYLANGGTGEYLNAPDIPRLNDLLDPSSVAAMHEQELAAYESQKKAAESLLKFLPEDYWGSNQLVSPGLVMPGQTGDDFLKQVEKVKTDDQDVVGKLVGTAKESLAKQLEQFNIAATGNAELTDEYFSQLEDVITQNAALEGQSNTPVKVSVVFGEDTPKFIEWLKQGKIYDTWSDLDVDTQKKYMREFQAIRKGTNKNEVDKETFIKENTKDAVAIKDGKKNNAMFQTMANDLALNTLTPMLPDATNNSINNKERLKNIQILGKRMTTEFVKIWTHNKDFQNLTKAEMQEALNQSAKYYSNNVSKTVDPKNRDILGESSVLSSIDAYKRAATQALEEASKKKSDELIKKLNEKNTNSDNLMKTKTAEEANIDILLGN